ncbi:hypothetical protein GP486_003781 [Trichoglossum hirsutum]|uniref:F-box domain-containing protein n=1 Tax=Trichoglossum hirsutum TaxID=265104 RepID=A0A9P8RQP0_9PEZI|nr:hypothetical protein GP486_003781 [Trichoglossum hirsutum]
MPAAGLSSLPPELHHLILSQLPPASLLAFSRTSRRNYALHLRSLTALRLGIFHSRIASLLSLLLCPPSEDFCGNNSNNSNNGNVVCVFLSRAETRTRRDVLARQNTLSQALLARYPNIQTLDLLLWDIAPKTLLSISALPSLRHLSIRLDHPHIRHPDVSRAFWEGCAPGTMWNCLSSTLGSPEDRGGREPGRPMGGRLLTLRLERCGITDYQLECLLKDHPLMRELRLKKCSVLTDELFEAMARSPALATRLTLLSFTNTANEAIDARILPYIRELKALKTLSLDCCAHLPNELVKHFNDTEWMIPGLILPYEEDPAAMAEVGRGIEVDDQYK